MYPPILRLLIAQSTDDLLADLEVTAPFMSERITHWLGDLFGAESLDRVFMRIDAFPLLLFPWWLEASHRQPDAGLQGDLISSSISGYLYIRLIDNLMDGDAPADPGLLPALAFFHTRFTEPYQRRFEIGHPFWSEFRTIWIENAEMTTRDRALVAIDRERFTAVSARKTGAARIPLGAVAYSVGRPDLLADWYRLVDTFGCWHQMKNDLFGWRKDLTHGASTYFLSEATRSMVSGESLEEWFIRFGFEWGRHELDLWMAELKQLAQSMGSPALLDYLERRRLSLQEEAGKVNAALAVLKRLDNEIDPRPASVNRGR